MYIVFIFYCTACSKIYETISGYDYVYDSKNPIRRLENSPIEET